jgi:hypothetical protein
LRRLVAIVSSCAPPQAGRPSTGGGLRVAQLAATVRAGGHAVRVLVERAALPRAEDATGFELVDDLHAALRTLRPDIVVAEQWALASRVPDGLPLVLDLHGSLLLENVYRRGAIELVDDAGAKLDALRRAALLLAPAPAQLHHFAAWATLAGFDPRALPLALLPLAPSTAPAAPRSEAAPALSVVYGGARWPWIDSLPALTAAADTIAKLPGARLDVATFDPPAPRCCVGRLPRHLAGRRPRAGGS